MEVMQNPLRLKELWAKRIEPLSPVLRAVVILLNKVLLLLKALQKVQRKKLKPKIKPKRHQAQDQDRGQGQDRGQDRDQGQGQDQGQDQGRGRDLDPPPQAVPLLLHLLFVVEVVR